jgi:hypothetical protein
MSEEKEKEKRDKHGESKYRRQWKPKLDTQGLTVY